MMSTWHTLCLVLNETAQRQGRISMLRIYVRTDGTGYISLREKEDEGLGEEEGLADN